jgi:hypothetical protein
VKRLLNQLRVQSLAALLLATGIFSFGCASAPVYPPPQADKSQIVVKVSATPKAGVQGPRTEGQYDKESVEKGRRFTRVNYSKMDCIAVVVQNASGTQDPPHEVAIEISESGFVRDLALVYVGSKGGTLHVENNRTQNLTLFGSSQGPSQATFEVSVPAWSTRDVKLYEDELFDIYCDEDEHLYCQVLATKSLCAQLCESGGEAFFEGLAPGAYDIEVFAPRLPVWKAKINTTAGKRETLYAEVTVNKLPKK